MVQRVVDRLKFPVNCTSMLNFLCVRRQVFSRLKCGGYSIQALLDFAMVVDSPECLYVTSAFPPLLLCFFVGHMKAISVPGSKPPVGFFSASQAEGRLRQFYRTVFFYSPSTSLPSKWVSPAQHKTECGLIPLRHQKQHAPRYNGDHNRELSGRVVAGVDHSLQGCVLNLSCKRPLPEPLCTF